MSTIFIPLNADKHLRNIWVMDIKPEELQIVFYPDPVLREKCKPVEKIDEDIIALVQRMIVLMREANGAGLAAPQVGVPLRIFIADEEDAEGGVRVYINPEITPNEEVASPYEEGCLSLPGMYANIMRPGDVNIKATDLNGNTYEATSDERMARVWQHETDHLNGVLIIDKFGMIDRIRHKKKLAGMEADYNKANASEEKPKKKSKKRRKR